MNVEQVVQEIQQEIVAIKTKQNNDHNRIEENKALGMEIHKVSVNLGHLTEQLKGQNERMDKLIDSYDARLKSQGERIGDIGTKVGGLTKVQEVLNEKMLKRLDAVEKDVDEFKTKGSRRWDGIVEKIIFLTVGAIIMFLLAQIGL